jgi:hypothetical protein
MLALDFGGKTRSKKKLFLNKLILTFVKNLSLRKQQKKSVLLSNLASLNQWKQNSSCGFP